MSPGKISNIFGVFISNKASKDGGAIAITDNPMSDSLYINSISGDFIGNSTFAVGHTKGGAIYISVGEQLLDKVDISGSFIGNYSKSQNGIALGGLFIQIGT